jgi:hypothetical protein
VRWLGRAALTLVLLLLVTAAVGLYVTYAPAGDTAPHPFNLNRNAVWLEHRWLEKPQTTADMEALFTLLSKHGILYAYPHILPFNGTGRLPVHDREQLRAFLATARRVAPEMKLLPWVGGVRVGYKRMRPGSVDLADIGQRQRIVAECRGLIDEGFDGVHVNVEPVDDGNDDYLALLRALKTAVGPDHILSVSAVHPGPIALPFAPNFLWTPGYYGRVGSIADQVVVMSYDTALPTAKLYRRYVAWAASTITARFAGGPARVLIGVPTYDDNNLVHRAGVETPGNALEGVVAGLRGVGAGGTFEGVALYAEWTTDDTDWAVYDRIWRGKQ